MVNGENMNAEMYCLMTKVNEFITSTRSGIWRTELDIVNDGKPVGRGFDGFKSKKYVL